MDRGINLPQILSTDEKKYTGVQLTVKKGEYIQWDGLYAAENDSGEKKSSFFLIETKEIPNPCDIFQNERNLYGKVCKTLKYFDQLSTQPLQTKPTTRKTIVDFQKEQIADFLNVQLDGSESMICPSEIAVVYASGNMPSNLIEELGNLSSKFKGKIEVWSTECPRLTTCDTTVLS